MTLYQYIIDLFTSHKTPRLLGDIESVLGRSESEAFVNAIALQIEARTRNLDRQAAIAIYLPRKNAFLAAIFASWKTGNFYIPLNQDWPVAHTEKILKHLKPDLIISDSELFAEYAPILQPDMVFEKVVVPCDVAALWEQKSLEPGLAYIIYTSGSTGEQKGVMIDKDAFTSYIAWTKSNFPDLGECSKLLINGEMTFDISLADIAFSLAHDIEIHLSPEANNLFAHIKLIIDRKIDSLYAVPSTLNHIYQWVESRGNIDLGHLKYIFSGGDVLDIDLIKILNRQSPSAIIYNMYGPTEVTMNCLSIRVDDRILEIADTSIVPTGTPSSHLRVKLLPTGDEDGGEEAGELVVAGDQLMRGYLNDTSRTEGAFVNIDGDKYYKTGDFFRCVNNVFYFVDRIDSLVKIKGYRINLADITNLILGKGFIKEARVVSLDSSSDGQKILVAVILHTDDVTDDDAATQLNQLCKKVLPAYMIPTKFLSIQKFPYGKTGKHDIKMLEKIVKEALGTELI
jgi:D-alanine--poly(phosphoribitol) ligase subunit 1